MMKITIIPLLKDNYAYLLEAPEGGVAVVDPGEAAPVQKVLEARDLRLDYIFNTHHHGDHIAGNDQLKKRYGCQIAGPAKDAHRINGLDIKLREGDHLFLGATGATIIETPGHTTGHICFHFPDDAALFCGDTLFSMGCGRLFEGTADDMWRSLQKIAALPDDTKIYCGHEYTLANALFCIAAAPDNPAIKKRLKAVKELRAAGKPTIPSTLALEKQTNIFMQAKNTEIFAGLRAQKDSF